MRTTKSPVHGKRDNTQATLDLSFFSWLSDDQRQQCYAAAWVRRGWIAELGISGSMHYMRCAFESKEEAEEALDRWDAALGNTHPAAYPQPGCVYQESSKEAYRRAQKRGYEIANSF